jgi:hypothetical protein
MPVSNQSCLRLLLAIAASVAVVSACAAWGLWQRRESGDLDWHAVYDSSFPPGKPAAGIEVSAADIDGRAATAPAGADGLPMHGAELSWIPAAAGDGDLRITAELRWHGQVDGFEMLLGVPRSQMPAMWNVPPGFSCQFAGWQGSQTFIACNQEAGHPSRLSAVAVPFVPERDYRLTASVTGDTISLAVDGAEVYRHRQALPSGGHDHRQVAIRSWGTVSLRRLTVERRSLSSEPSPLLGGDALTRVGLFPEAYQAYAAAAAAYPDGTVGEQALAKAYLAGLRSAQPEADLLALRDRLAGAHPGSRWLQDVGEAESLAHWLAGRWAAALHCAAQVLARWPDSRIALDLLAQRPAGVPSASAQRLIELIRIGPAPARLDLSRLGLSDLSGITGMPLVSLDISGNQISDMAPLVGMPLGELVAPGNQIGDLRPLLGMPLWRLDLAGDPVADLAPLASMRLRLLSLEGSAVTDLAPLAGQPLQELKLAGAPVSDLRPLAGCPALNSLLIDGTGVSDLSPLAKLPLRTLRLNGSAVEDLHPLAGMPLESLDISCTRVSDVSPLIGLPLRHLQARGNRIADAGPLVGLRLNHLDLGGNPLTALPRGLTGDGPDAAIRLSGCPISDLAPLVGSGFSEVVLGGGPAPDLAPLAGMPLRRLRLHDLDGLRPGQLQTIAAAIISLDGLGTAAGEIEALAAARTGAGAAPQTVRGLWAQALIAAGEHARLRLLAQRIGDRDRLWTGIVCPWERACAIAAAAGARLYCPVDLADLRRVRRECTGEAAFWTGAQLVPGDGWRWADGRRDLPSFIAPPDPASGSGDGWALPALGLGDNLMQQARPSWPRKEGAFGLVLEWDGHDR